MAIGFTVALIVTVGFALRCIVGICRAFRHVAAQMKPTVSDVAWLDTYDGLESVARRFGEFDGEVSFSDPLSWTPQRRRRLTRRFAGQIIAVVMHIAAGLLWLTGHELVNAVILYGAGVFLQALAAYGFIRSTVAIANDFAES